MGELVRGIHAQPLGLGTARRAIRLLTTGSLYPRPCNSPDPIIERAVIPQEGMVRRARAGQSEESRGHVILGEMGYRCRVDGWRGILADPDPSVPLRTVRNRFPLHPSPAIAA